MAGKWDPVHGTQEAAERARVAARQASGWLRDEAARLYAGYDRQSRFFKYRVWIVAAWVTLSLSSVAVALWPDNVIGAVVRTAPDPADGSPIISVENGSSRSWRDVVIVLDGVYEFSKPSLSPGESLQVHARNFVHKDHRDEPKAGLPPQGYRPQVITVRAANRGAYTTRLE